MGNRAAEMVSPRKLLARAKAAHAAGAHSSALEDLEKILAVEPDYADIHNLRGLCLLAVGRPRDATAAFEAAISINEEYAEAHRNRATALRVAGRIAEAQLAESRFAELSELPQSGRYPASVAAHLANEHAALGDMYAAHGFLLEAVEQYRRACRLRPEFIDIRNRLARALIELGILEAAHNELNAVLTINPDYIEARANLGIALARTGEIDAARAEWSRCLELQPGNRRVVALMAMLDKNLEGTGDWSFNEAEQPTETGRDRSIRHIANTDAA